MNKRPLAAAVITLATAFALSKFAGMTPRAQAPEAGGVATRGRPVAYPHEAAGTQDEDEAMPAATEQPLPVRAAVEDFADSLDLPTEAVQVLKVDAVTWPDGSLGCPQPGMQYIQMLTEGFRITLEAEGELAEYHTDTSTQALRCEGGPGGAGAAPTD